MPTVINPPYIGAFGALGLAKEGAATFGTPVAATSYVPVKDIGIIKQPGLIDIYAARGVREKRTYVASGEQKITGPVTFPFFSQMGMALLVGAIGVDTEQFGSTPANATTTTAIATAGTFTVALTSVTGYAVNGFITLDITPKREVRKILSIAALVVTVDIAWTFTHASGASANTVVAPFTHIINTATVLPSFTLEKNLGGLTSVQYAGCIINKLTLKGATKQEIECTIDVMGQSDLQITPTVPVYTAEQPIALAGATLSLFGASDANVESFDWMLENNSKERYTYSGKRYPTFIVPDGRTMEIKLTEVLTAMTYYNQIQSASAGVPPVGAAVITLNDGTNSSVLTFPQTSIADYSDPLKIGDSIVISFTLKVWIGNLANSFSATVQSSQYSPF